jgi:hypothetical protein
MSDHFERTLRGAMETMTHRPPPTNLAGTAIRTARRRQVTRWAVAGALTVLVVASLTAGIGTIRPAAPGNTVGGSVQPLRPQTVTAYNRVAAPGKLPWDSNLSLLLDRKTGGYVPVPYYVAVPSPDGRSAAVQSNDTPVARTGILDRVSGRVRWLPDGPLRGGPRWSSSGDRVLFSASEGPDTFGFEVIDARTLAGTFVATPGAIFFDWLPDDSGLVTLGGTSDRANPVDGVRYYNLDGTVRRSIPIALGPATNLSAQFDIANGRILITTWDAATKRGTVHQLDSDSGQASVLPLTLASGQQIVARADADHVLVFTVPAAPPTTGPKGEALHPSALTGSLAVVDLAGNVTRTVPVPSAAAGGQVGAVGSSAGLPGSAADLTF